MALPTLYRWIGLPTLAIYRLLTWAILGTGFTFVALVLTLRYWVLPNIEDYREDIALAVSKAADQRVAIGRISGNWDGIRPELILQDVTVFDRAGRPALRLARVDHTLSWLSVVALEPRFHSIELHQPSLRVVRDRNGVISVAGVELKDHEVGTGFSDWLLRQREIVVRDASIVWHDELRGTPPLPLEKAQLVLRNDGNRHRFGLRAAPPVALAGAVELRGDLSGESVASVAQWEGRLFAKVDAFDIAAWRTWVPQSVLLPQSMDLSSGAGAVQAWLTVGRNGITDLVADVKQANVKARLGTDLPELDLTELSGRIAWKVTANSFEFSTLKLSLATRQGLVLPPADFLLRLESGKDRKPLRGELRANALDLEPLMVLADRLPLAAELRKQLVAAAPKGSLFDVVLRWNGEWSSPSQVTARGRFQGLALTRSGAIPGFSGLSGNVDGTDRAGTLHFNNVDATLDMPRVFAEPLAFDTLTGQMQWSREPGRMDIRLNNVAFANPDMAGNLFGAYRHSETGPGTIDLSGNLTRADARRVVRYVPITVAKAARPWLSSALVSGQSNDVRFQVKGDLARFPFPDNKGGTFFVAAKIIGGTLDYADGWPRMENIEGDLAFRGKRMEVHVRQGSILGVRLPKVQAEIADLETAAQVLAINGEAEGPTADFLEFIAKSPVAVMTDRLTERMQAQGRGRLALKLTLPLHSMANSKVSGVYQFTGNRLVGDPDLPPVEQFSGRLEFNESEVRMPAATATFLGGPVSISAGTQRDAAVRLVLQGRIDADNVRRAGGAAWMRYLRGSTDWRGTLTFRRKLTDLVIESSLQGIASALPAPFVKSAAESVALKFEHQVVGPQQDRWLLNYGNTVSAVVLRRVDGKSSAIERGTVRFGEGSAPEPERAGLWLTGALKSLDIGDWLKLLGETGAGPTFTLGGVDVRVTEFDLFGRRFHDLAVKGASQPGGMQIALAGREIEGSANWLSEGKGRATVRLSRLTIPESGPKAVVAEVEKPAAAERTYDLPALDVVAEQFQVGNKQLGRLELSATPQERDWRIERLRVSNPDGALAVDGVWQNWLTRPQTRVNIRFDVTDVGKMLARFGYPEGMRRGAAKIEGNLLWSGSPQEIDYPTLTGNFVLDSTKGQFNKLEPGFGKLLGILSLQSLPRRITLDFRDIFSDGFAYDQIIGAVKVTRGMAATENFRIDGPSARVNMSGEVDLARETQKLNVKVIPSISDTVAIAGALIGGPIAGVATFLAQKLLKDPLDQIVSHEYTVTGTWSDPVVTKVQRPVAIDTTRPE